MSKVSIYTKSRYIECVSRVKYHDIDKYDNGMYRNIDVERNSRESLVRESVTEDLLEV